MVDILPRSALFAVLLTLVLPMLPEPVWASLLGIAVGLFCMWAAVGGLVVESEVER